ncbi:hypothetical protein G6F31_017009 [Rhizopus arrhizus]|nr:hypothetical protein G6F31_017009 [Rhizopus arrhizus]
MPATTQPGRIHQPASGNHESRVIPQGQFFADRRHEERGQGVGQQRQAGLHAVVAQAAVEIDRQVDDEWPEAEVHPYRTRERTGEVAVAEHGKINHGLAAAFLGGDESDEAGDRQADDAQCHRASEAQHRALRDEQHQAEYRDGKRQDARDIQGPHLRIARFLHRGVVQDQGDHRQAAMHQENPFPARQREDGAAHDRPEAQADAEDDAPP